MRSTNPLAAWDKKQWVERCEEVKEAGLKFKVEDIEKIVDLMMFENRRLKHPERCEPCYSSNNPCHNISSDYFNCLLCACPNYEKEKDCGGCKTKNIAGRFIQNYRHSKNGAVWDCSECNFGHTAYDAYTFLHKNLEWLKKISESPRRIT